MNDNKCEGGCIRCECKESSNVVRLNDPKNNTTMLVRYCQNAIKKAQLEGFVVKSVMQTTINERKAA